MRQRLKESACRDYVLLSNLEFSERVFRHNPLNKAMTLQVKGEWRILRIGKSNNLIYTVSSEDGETRIDCCIYTENDVIKEADIKNIHFIVHSCQNESRSCFTQAKDAVKVEHQALKVTCNKFSITYTAKGQPEDMKMIQTKCQLTLPHITAEGLMEKKSWMKKEKTKCYDLIVGLDYLIEKYLTTSEAPESNCSFILQGSEERIEIISDLPNNQPRKQFNVKIGRNLKVEVYPPLGSSP